MRGPLLVLVAVLGLALPGCAGLDCTPATIVVAEKDERSRLRSEPTGLRTDGGTGRASVQRREVIVSEYWVRDREDRWHRVSEAAWRAAEPGQPLEVCR